MLTPKQKRRLKQLRQVPSGKSRWPRQHTDAERAELQSLEIIEQFLPKNEKWARKANRALKAYRGKSKPDEADLRDLLTGLMHLADQRGIDFGDEYGTATNNYRAESI